MQGDITTRRELLGQSSEPKHDRTQAGLTELCSEYVPWFLSAFSVSNLDNEVGLNALCDHSLCKAVLLLPNPMLNSMIFVIWWYGFGAVDDVPHFTWLEHISHSNRPYVVVLLIFEPIHFCLWKGMYQRGWYIPWFHQQKAVRLIHWHNGGEQDLQWVLYTPPQVPMDSMSTHEHSCAVCMESTWSLHELHEQSVSSSWAVHEQSMSTLYQVLMDSP